MLTTLISLGVQHTSPIIYRDSMSTVSFVREKVLGKKLQLVHNPAADQYVDILREVLSSMHFEAMRSKLTVCDLALLQASHPP
ncbi:hypothetical protein A2U01_0062225 [Trifolium medium]|uniref:Uncharacterized protein n=1 Tax=Trifolium medium TaxID=97028 RepID=A0A392RXW8_9FABA|nr:hypothetical protein [Trifolium medium]